MNQKSTRRALHLPLASERASAWASFSLVVLAACRTGGAHELFNDEPQGATEQGLADHPAKAPSGPSQAPQTPASSAQTPAPTEQTPAPPAPPATSASTAPSNAAPASDANPSTPAGEPASNDNGSPSTGDTPVDPEDDEEIQFLKDNGYQTQYFAQTCRSVAEDGSAIEGSEQPDLPVGNGRVLECETASFPSQSTIEFLSSADERWCALGRLSTYEGGGDDRLRVDVASVPGDGPGTLIGSRDGDAITIHTVSGFGGAMLWPLWITTTYAVTDVQRSEPGKLCDEVFGL